MSMVKGSKISEGNINIVPSKKRANCRTNLALCKQKRSRTIIALVFWNMEIK
jgi:hypothetical protein